VKLNTNVKLNATTVFTRAGQGIVDVAFDKQAMTETGMQVVFANDAVAFLILYHASAGLRH
jgi:hypothetical protein